MKLVFAHILFAAFDGNVREGRVKSGFYSLKISEKSTYEHLSARNTCSFFLYPAPGLYRSDAGFSFLCVLWFNYV